MSRKPRTEGLAKATRVVEAARLLTLGLSIAQIARRFDVSDVTVGKYIKEAEDLGHIKAFSEKRDSQVQVIVGKNLDILGDTTEMLAEKVKLWKTAKKEDQPSVATILAVAAHAAKISGTVKDERPPDINIQQVQNNIIMLQKAEDDLMERLGMGKKPLPELVDVAPIEQLPQFK